MWYKKLYWWILISMVIGLVTGLVLNSFQITFCLPFLDFLGNLFIKLLKMIIVPLVISSIIMGVANIENTARLGRIGVRTALYYFATTGLAVFVGMVMVNIIRPGIGFDSSSFNTAIDYSKFASHSWYDLILSLVPSNPIKAMAETEILSLIFFSLLLGFVITILGEKGKPVKDFFGSLFEIMTKMTSMVMWVAPVGTFALIAEIVAVTGLEVVEKLLMYCITVLSGLAFHALITLPSILIIFGRYNPLKLFGNMSVALATAFSTSSSSATLPLTMECAEKELKASKEVSSFVLPLGATMNMDGTALYESVATIFIAQVYLGHSLPLSQQIIVFVTATLAAVGAAGVPSAGTVMMVIVLNAVGLPIEGIGLILAVDRILDMCRTTVNVWGDSVGVAVVARSEGENL